MRHFFVIASLGLSLGLFVGAAGAQQSDQPMGGGMFNAPGYPSLNTAPRNGSTPSGGTFGSQQGGTTQGMPSDSQPPTLRSQGTGTRMQDGQGNIFDARALRRLNREPPKPSEFQKFVERATGRMLPLFGSKFFESAADPLDVLTGVPVSADYVVGPGDELIIRAWGSLDADFRAVVDRNGQISLPRVGTFNVAGVKAADLGSHLRAQIARMFTNFDLNVTLGQLRATKVFVVGPALRPGVYTLPSQATMLSAVVAAGGPSPNGSMRRVSLRRDGKIVSDLDIYDFLVQGDKSKDLQLIGGDVVVFYPSGPQVALNGAIDTAAIYELETPQEPIGEVLRYAGGAPVLANPNSAQLERIDPTQRAARFVEEFPLDVTGLAKTLRDGDVLTLLAISPKFANAVTLRGHVAQPLRYPYRPGMRITDLIPDKEALISPDFYRRKNLLVQVIEDEDYNRRRGSARRFSRDGRDGYDDNRSEDGSYRNGGYADDRYRDDRYRDETGTERDRRSANDRPYAERRDDPNARGLPDERSRRDGLDRRDDRPRSAVAELDRDIARDALNRRTPMPLFDELNWDYAVIERLNRDELRTQIIPFNLGRAVLQGDASQNIELQPGDVVTVYSQKDVRVPVARQTRLVALEGEVSAPGVYQLEAGETLRSLIQRAGGLTPQAYAYGLEFSREETRRRQRENLAAALTRLESLSATQAARDAANRRDDARSGDVSNAATQAQIARLARLQPNGRIALELNPGTDTVAELPELPLEHGDRISVPARPGFVTVAGAVVNTNAFLWKPGRTAGDYVRLAGLDEAAEPGNMFILRADGTVTHANDSRGFFGYGGIDSQTMQPGDAVIVPNQLDYETWGRALVRNLKDYSQIFSQFGLGIAAINSLKD